MSPKLSLTSATLGLRCISWWLLLIVITVGWNAHFNGYWKIFWNDPISCAQEPYWDKCSGYCMKDPKCPYPATDMELCFVTLTFIAFGISTAVSVASLLRPLDKTKEVMLQIFLGVILQTAGLRLILASNDIYNAALGVRGNNIFQDHTSRIYKLKLDNEEELKSLLKHMDKLAAGTLGVVTGCLHYGIAVLLGMTAKQDNVGALDSKGKLDDGVKVNTIT